MTTFRKDKIFKQEYIDYSNWLSGLSNYKINQYARQFHKQHFRNKHFDEPVSFDIAHKAGKIRRERVKRGLIKKPISVEDVLSDPEYKRKKKKWIRFWKQWAIDNNVEYYPDDPNKNDK